MVNSCITNSKLEVEVILLEDLCTNVPAKIIIVILLS